MPKLDRSEFKYNAKVFEKTCLWCGTVYFASRSTAKYCSSTCRGYANQAKNAEEMVPYDETEKMISALLSENAYLKGQVQRYVLENQQLLEKLRQAFPDEDFSPKSSDATGQPSVTNQTRHDG